MLKKKGQGTIQSIMEFEIRGFIRVLWAFLVVFKKFPSFPKNFLHFPSFLKISFISFIHFLIFSFIAKNFAPTYALH